MHSADDLVSRIQQIAERAKQRPRPPAKPAQPAKVVRLPLWPTELRTCPSCVLRSALVRGGPTRAAQGPGRRDSGHLGRRYHPLGPVRK
jgi:hypothetical protein